MKAPPKDVDDYLASVPPEARAILETLRKRIKAAAPEATGTISYAMPAFKLGERPLVAFAAFKNHCSFFPMSASIVDAHMADLSGYETSKGTIRFPIGKPLPAALVRKLVEARIAENKLRATR